MSLDGDSRESALRCAVLRSACRVALCLTVAVSSLSTLAGCYDPCEPDGFKRACTNEHTYAACGHSLFTGTKRVAVKRTCPDHEICVDAPAKDGISCVAKELEPCAGEGSRRCRDGLLQQCSQVGSAEHDWLWRAARPCQGKLVCTGEDGTATCSAPDKPPAG